MSPCQLCFAPRGRSLREAYTKLCSTKAENERPLRPRHLYKETGLTKSGVVGVAIVLRPLALRRKGDEESRVGVLVWVSGRKINRNIKKKLQSKSATDRRHKSLPDEAKMFRQSEKGPARLVNNKYVILCRKSSIIFLQISPRYRRDSSHSISPHVFFDAWTVIESMYIILYIGISNQSW